MLHYWTLIKSDYLQRTRSYAFIISVCLSLALAYSFIPSPTANYSTLTVDGHVGVYNSAWLGYMSAIMASVFVSLIGFYLVNSGIKKDIETGVGNIAAATSTSNLNYLMAKALSNFLVLLTITVVILFVSILLFFRYNTGYPFELQHFLLPYLLIPLPAIFFTSILAVVAEILLRKSPLLQNILYFFLFSALAVINPTSELGQAADIYGTKLVTQKMGNTIDIDPDTGKKYSISIGYTNKSIAESKNFVFEGVNFPLWFTMSRVIIVLLSLLLIILISPFFHRFSIRRPFKKGKPMRRIKRGIEDLDLSTIPPIKPNYSIIPLYKIELLLLFRKGPKWLWLINLGGMIGLLLAPISMAHSIILPLLWFFQVARWSEITTKEKYNGVHFFSFASFRPIARLLNAQFLAATSISIVLALPLVIRYTIESNLTAAFAILVGAVFLVMAAAAIGIISNSKKLFEILFFLTTYANINAVPYADYFGGLHTTAGYSIIMILLCCLLFIGSLLIRNYELKSN